MIRSGWRVACALTAALGAAALGACGGSDPTGGGDGGGDPDAAASGPDGGTDGPDAAALVCGDRRVDAPEECDDGNTTSGDGCDDMCRLETSPNCGDSIVDYALGEECDDGNTVSGDGCDASCRVEAAATCGDGVLDLANGEQCDDGDNLPGDGCSPTCQFEPLGAFCGDSTLDPNEACDDGNTLNGDACNPTCNFQNGTSLFVGMPGAPGNLDGIGSAAQIGGYGVITATDTHLWLSDGANHIVRRIEIATALVETVAGTGSPGFQDDPNGLSAQLGGVEAITTDGLTIWIADSGRIRTIQTTIPHGVVSVAGQAPGAYQPGNGAQARFDDLRGLTYYGGLVYFVDANAAVLGSFDPATGDVVTLAGTPYNNDCPPGAMPQDGIGAAASFCSPRYMASDNSGMLYVADTNGNTMRGYNPVTGQVTTFAGTGSCGYADGTGTAAEVHRPRGMTSDGTSLYWVEFNAHTIRQGVLATGDVSTMVGAPPACTLTCSCPQAPAGSYQEGVGAAAALDNPFSVTYHFPSRSLFFVDGGNAVIRRIQ
jgi:cysteine-rich repeat protein